MVYLNHPVTIPGGTSDYITKGDFTMFWSLFFVSIRNLNRRYLFIFFVFEIPSLKLFLICFYIKKVVILI